MVPPFRTNASETHMWVEKGCSTLGIFPGHYCMEVINGGLKFMRKTSQCHLKQVRKKKCCRVVISVASSQWAKINHLRGPINRRRYKGCSGHGRRAPDDRLRMILEDCSRCSVGQVVKWVCCAFESRSDCTRTMPLKTLAHRPSFGGIS